MKLENQVCTLEQAKRLKELGVTGAQYYHFQGRVTNEAWGNDYFPAFTAAELLAMLPSTYKYAGNDYTIHIGKSKDGVFECGYIGLDAKLSSPFMFIRNDINVSNCLCKVLIYLIENKHITPELVNDKLLNS